MWKELTALHDRRGWLTLLGAIVVFGVYPQLMFDVMDPAVTALVEHVGAGIP